MDLHLVSMLKWNEKYLQFKICVTFSTNKISIILFQNSEQKVATLEEEKKHLEFMNEMKKFDDSDRTNTAVSSLNNFRVNFELTGVIWDKII